MDDPAEVLARFPDRVCLCGGRTGRVGAMPASSGTGDITRLPYDGPADRWFDPAWVLAER